VTTGTSDYLHQSGAARTDDEGAVDVPEHQDASEDEAANAEPVADDAVRWTLPRVGQKVSTVRGYAWDARGNHVSAQDKADLDWFLTARYTTQSWKPTPLVYVVLPQPPAQAMMNINGLQ